MSPSTRLEEICVESVKNLVAGGIIDESVMEDDTTLGSTGEQPFQYQFLN